MAEPPPGPDGPGWDGPGELAATDRFIDALADGQCGIDDADPADRALAALLAGWRDELRAVPDDDLITEQAAVAAVRAGSFWRRGLQRGLTLAATAAATVSVLGGFGAVVAGSGPGDPLYGVRSVLFGAPVPVDDDDIGLAAKTELETAQQLITDGRWDEAQQRLASAVDTMQTVNDVQRRLDLVDRWNVLNIQLQQRGPGETSAISGSRQPLR